MHLDSYNNPDAEALLRAAPERLARPHEQRRELIASIIGASGFLIVAGVLAAAAPHTRSLSLSSLALVLVVWIAIERVTFPVAGGWTRPTVLAFVPALFLLPTAFVPIVAMVAIMCRQAPALLRRRIDAALVPGFIADAWFTVGPVLVLVLAGAQNFAWSRWPIYLVALAAQFVFDGAAAVWWSWAAEGVSPRVQLPLLGFVYVVDAALAPLGLLIAGAAVQRHGLILIALSPIAMFHLFARERHQRLDQTLALSTAYRGTALLLGDIVEADDHYTGTHSRDVVDLSVGVADTLGLDSVTRRNVEFAALLHDVGKIRVPKEIINKPGALDDAEWEILRQHTIDGETMLKQVGGMLSGIGRLVRSSHERFDGLGYPDGIAGEEIPIESRIVSACDAFSAMTTDRSYRPALSVESAVEELRRCSGSQFDPLVVEALEGLVSVHVTPTRRPDRRGIAA
jgi:HD-GYP domain-containing protein (c-di-GMP phosphodiesterase class II)